jgi:hypothetical protein
MRLSCSDIGKWTGGRPWRTVLVNADREELQLLNHSLNFVQYIEYSCIVPVILDSGHSGKKKHHPDRPVV